MGSDVQKYRLPLADRDADTAKPMSMTHFLRRVQGIQQDVAFVYLVNCFGMIKPLDVGYFDEHDIPLLKSY